MSASRTIAVCGAGIGGLTAALALARRGFAVTIVERAERLEEAGAGLQLSPNASRLLIKLGLGADLSARAIAPEAIGIFAARSGRPITRIPLGAAAAQRAGAPYWVLHRADLQAALLAAVEADPAITLRLGTQLRRAAPTGDGVEVIVSRASSEETIHAAGLVGADGVWSAVRSQFFPAIKPQFANRIAWRGTIDAARLARPFPPREVQLWLGPAVHLVAYPMSGGRRVNLVAFTPGEWHEPGWSAAGDGDEIRRWLVSAGWAGDVCRLVDAVGEWRRWALFAMPDGGAWARDRVALLGDASHAMLPFMAQGAAMAIEDAAVLARCLAASPDAPAQAFARYQALRQRRVTRVQRTARQNDKIYHLSGPIALARNLTMAALGGERLLRRQDWIYRWRDDGG